MAFRFKQGDKRAKPRLKLIHNSWQVVGESFANDPVLLQEAYWWCIKQTWKYAVKQE